ncbi:uncharacterized protein LOC106051357 isoform X2 [Biomphalaria glabrata]|uniref:Uncharacterized protein LOC106051357 isoform X2 n=1 Tax=Biomphalaria glabrata TaxID=6526 RepID=A0A9W3AYQ7_BIOGL|nr:uncharacterized protein LOC106051357 isoform X2 [Biomphalaria glabrata]
MLGYLGLVFICLPIVTGVLLLPVVSQTEALLGDIVTLSCSLEHFEEKLNLTLRNVKELVIERSENGSDKFYSLLVYDTANKSCTHVKWQVAVDLFSESVEHPKESCSTEQPLGKDRMFFQALHPVGLCSDRGYYRCRAVDDGRLILTPAYFLEVYKEKPKLKAYTVQTWRMSNQKCFFQNFTCVVHGSKTLNITWKYQGNVTDSLYKQRIISVSEDFCTQFEHTLQVTTRRRKSDQWPACEVQFNDAVIYARNKELDPSGKEIHSVINQSEAFFGDPFVLLCSLQQFNISSKYASIQGLSLEKCNSTTDEACDLIAVNKPYEKTCEVLHFRFRKCEVEYHNSGHVHECSNSAEYLKSEQLIISILVNNPPATCADSGLYRCVAELEDGTRVMSSLYSLKVYARPMVVKFDLLDVPNSVDDSFVCIAHGNEDLDIRWSNLTQLNAKIETTLIQTVDQDCQSFRYTSVAQTKNATKTGVFPVCEVFFQCQFYEKIEKPMDLENNLVNSTLVSEGQPLVIDCSTKYFNFKDEKVEYLLLSMHVDMKMKPLATYFFHNSSIHQHDVTGLYNYTKSSILGHVHIYLRTTAVLCPETRRYSCSAITHTVGVYAGFEQQLNYTKVVSVFVISRDKPVISNANRSTSLATTFKCSFQGPDNIIVLWEDSRPQTLSKVKSRNPDQECQERFLYETKITVQGSKAPPQCNVLALGILYETHHIIDPVIALEVIEGESFTLTCTNVALNVDVNNVETISIFKEKDSSFLKWLSTYNVRTNQLYKSDEHSQLVVNKSGVVGISTNVTKVTCSDWGHYRCMATLKNMELIEVWELITIVAKVQTPSIKVAGCHSRGECFIDFMDNAHLTCEYTGPFAEEVEWFFSEDNVHFVPIDKYLGLKKTVSVVSKLNSTNDCILYRHDHTLIIYSFTKFGIFLCRVKGYFQLRIALDLSSRFKEEMVLKFSYSTLGAGLTVFVIVVVGIVLFLYKKADYRTETNNIKIIEDSSSASITVSSPVDHMGSKNFSNKSPSVSPSPASVSAPPVDSHV